MISFCLVAIASLRIAATWTVFNHTYDEPAHISCGLEYLSKGVYHYEHQHPPLTRVMVALGPFLMGERTSGVANMNYDGLIVLHRGGRYDTFLALSRAGNLPFFWLACRMVFLWGRRTHGPEGAVLAVFVFSTLPLVLAHAGLSTTDMGLTALFAAAMYALLVCLEKPGWRSGAMFGLSFAGMALSKFSGLAYFPAALGLCLVVWLSMRKPGVRGLLSGAARVAPALALSVPVALLVVWAGYWFSFGPWGWFSFPVPFPELFSGIDQVRQHNAAGHLTYLLGDISMQGWWLFFPLLFVIKTPIAVLLALFFPPAAGQPRKSAPAEGRRPAWMSWAIFAAILLVAINARINIGLRHVLPAFVFVSVIAAGGLLWLLRAAPARWWAAPAFAVLALWTAGTGALAHPDYIPYFNAFAGDHPENIVVDSDLDWGQDLKRLGARLHDLNAPSVTFTNQILANLDAFGFPPRQHSDPQQPSPGWNAVSLTEWKLYRLGLQLHNPEIKMWPDFVQPQERVGETILLYYFPPQGSPAPPR
jgi:hypothetical protein